MSRVPSARVAVELALQRVLDARGPSALSPEQVGLGAAEFALVVDGEHALELAAVLAVVGGVVAVVEGHAHDEHVLERLVRAAP